MVVWASLVLFARVDWRHGRRRLDERHRRLLVGNRQIGHHPDVRFPHHRLLCRLHRHAHRAFPASQCAIPPHHASFPCRAALLFSRDGPWPRHPRCTEDHGHHCHGPSGRWLRRDSPDLRSHHRRYDRPDVGEDLGSSCNLLGHHGWWRPNHANHRP